MQHNEVGKLFPFENACTAFPSTLVSMLELSPPLQILLILRVEGLSRLNTQAVLPSSLSLLVFISIPHISRVYYTPRPSRHLFVPEYKLLWRVSK
jgi:hypothetical protein